MDNQTLDSLANMICGGDGYPVYRTGAELTRFFESAGLHSIAHDGTSRKWWTLDVLKRLEQKDLFAVILRLADPKEYRGNQQQVQLALGMLNELLMIEGLKVRLDGISPKIEEITPQFAEQPDRELKPLPPPDFLKLQLDPKLSQILANRWDEAQRCLNAEAFLAAIIIMGSMLEGMLLEVMRKFPQEANQSKAAPIDPNTNKVRHFREWSLSDMINVAHDTGWIDLDVKQFSHALREFRNLIHPNEQMELGASPDEDSCGISWLVVQAASNDLAKKLM